MRPGDVRYVAREALLGFYRARGMNVLTVGIIAASLVIPGCFMLVVENLQEVAADWQKVQINAYFLDSAVQQRPDEVARLVASVRAEPIVREARFVSREEALSLFRSRFSRLAPAAESLSANPFPASLEISVRGDRRERTAATGPLLETLRSSPLVESVQDNEEEWRRLAAALSIATRIGLGVGAILVAAAGFIIFNVIRLTVHARRDEISIMRLVGATGGFIRGPFLLEGMLQGLAGALLALALLYAGHTALSDYALRSGNNLAALLTARFLPAGGALLLPGAGLLVGLTGSTLSLRRLLAD